MRAQPQTSQQSGDDKVKNGNKNPTRWITICFDTSHDFCKPLYNVLYDGFCIEVKRGNDTEGHEFYIEIPIHREKEGYEAGLRFLSEISWFFRTSVEVITWVSGGSKTKCNVANRKFPRVGNVINLDYYEQIADSHLQKLGLGFFKEGISSKSNFYKFLSFFKIINIKYANGPEQKKWINKNIIGLTRSRDKLNQLRKDGVTDFGEYLYHSGRCAIAHANIKPIIDVDAYDHNYRINVSAPIMQELADIFLRKELGLPKRF
ncbi:hypothetical protein KAU34_02250 [candidate division WOR-3 bacterium]|nr:hypothetical protein [candidate division WOR-3 bacterium]MCK4575211.1 hypothetical protein [candidate division WOR-3 bacterium]